MLYKHECLVCGKEFASNNKEQKYCSKLCRRVAFEERINRRGQICWNCKNATGNCLWSSCGKPVPGWEATPNTYDDEGTEVRSYSILTCPQFIWG
jgi:hypothetical protein